MTHIYIIWPLTILAFYYLGIRTGRKQAKHRKPRGRQIRQEQPSALLADEYEQGRSEMVSAEEDLLPLAQDFDFPRCHECGSWYVTIADMDVPGRYWCGDHGYVPEEESPTLPMIKHQDTDLLDRMGDFLSQSTLSLALA